jgi:hypothetical protein
MRIKTKDIPVLREKIIAEQAGKCWLCDIDLKLVVPCLDHDHETGKIRGVLCGNCNGIEGKIHNLVRRAKRQMSKVDFLNRVVAYWVEHTLEPRSEIHPTDKTPDENRLRRNKKATERRQKG